MSAPIWTPSPQRIEQANITAFTQQLEEKTGTAFADYAALHQWSLDDPAKFWQAVSDFCHIHYHDKHHTVMEVGHTLRETRWFSGATLNFAENLLSRRDDKCAIIFHPESGPRQTLSYRQLYQQVVQMAAGLKHAGIKKGDTVAAYMPNCPETVIAMLAASSLGAIWSSCSPDFGVEGVLDRFGQIKPKVLFACDAQQYQGKTHHILDKVEQLSRNIDSLEQIIILPFINDTPDISQIRHACLWQDFLRPADDIEFVSLAFDDPLYIMYSSGTTGVPKCIVHGVGGTLIQHLKELVLHSDVKQDDTLFFYTTCGWMMWNWVVSSLATGASLILFDGSPTYPTQDRLLEIIEKEQVSHFGSGAKYLSMLEKAQVEAHGMRDFSSLRCLLSTASPLSPSTFDYIYASIKPNLQLSSISGGTDILSCFALGNPCLPVYRGELQCAGLGMAVEIFDDKGDSLLDKKGDLVCTQAFPSMPLYFYNDPDSSKYRAAYFERFDNIWAHGDYAKINPHGGITIYGRSDAILNPGGIRIGTAEIYRQVETLDEIIDSIVIGQQWDDDVRIVLFVQCRPEITLYDALIAKIKKTIRSNTTPRHVPAKILQVSDIPRTLSGKIVEVAVKNAVHGNKINNLTALANPEALEEYKNRPELMLP